MKLRTTRETADELGLAYFGVFNLIRYGHIDPPAKTGAGHYLWSDADVAAARRAIEAHRAREEATTP